jgi:hypothetical protein
MEFDSFGDCEFCIMHPLHVEFVQTRWIPEGADFMEIDFEPLV